MELAYYPGCSGKGTSAEYERSTRVVCAALGIELRELTDWSCCGSTPAHACDERLSAALSGRNLALAAMQGADRVATPCPSCLSNLRTAHSRMQNPAFREKVDMLLDAPLPRTKEGGADVPDAVSVLQVLAEEYGIEAIKAKVTRPLSGLRIAPYYGCLLNRPADLMRFGDPENPTAMDRILEALGAEVAEFPCKTECCGAAMGIPRRDLTARLTGRLLQAARDFKADAVAVACPLCHMNLDLRQAQAGRAWKTDFAMPVLYFTQFMGLALGLSGEELGLDKLCVSPAGVLQKIRPVAASVAAEKPVEAPKQAAVEAAGSAPESVPGAASAASGQSGEEKA